jgi:hypothetical protein
MVNRWFIGSCWSTHYWSIEQSYAVHCKFMLNLGNATKLTITQAYVGSGLQMIMSFFVCAMITIYILPLLNETPRAL